MAAKTPKIVTTIINSISVNPADRREGWGMAKFYGFFPAAIVTFTRPD
jgi:predicted kinase